MKYKVTVEYTIESKDFDPEPQNADEVKEAYFNGDLELNSDETVIVVPA